LNNSRKKCETLKMISSNK